MKINEVTQHPAVAMEVEFTNLLQSGESQMGEMVEFVMNDKNADARRLTMLVHIDELLGDRKDNYSEADLDDFMHDQGDVSPEEADEIARDMRLPPYHLQSVDEETFSSDEDIPTGKYEVCQKCGGEGTVYWDHVDEFTGEHQPASAPCPDCESGLNDITGSFELPNFD